MSGEIVSRRALEAAWDADQAYARSPLRARGGGGGSWTRVGQGQLQRLLEGAASVLRHEDRAALRQQAMNAAVAAWLPMPSHGPYAVGSYAASVVPLETLLNLLDASTPEDPMLNLNAGREGYPPPQSYTVITGAGDRPLTITATSCHEDDEWLILDFEGRTVGKFRLSQIGGYYENAPASDPGTVAEGGHAA